MYHILHIDVYWNVLYLARYQSNTCYTVRLIRWDLQFFYWMILVVFTIGHCSRIKLLDNYYALGQMGFACAFWCTDVCIWYSYIIHIHMDASTFVGSVWGLPFNTSNTFQPSVWIHGYMHVVCIYTINILYIHTYLHTLYI